MLNRFMPLMSSARLALAVCGEAMFNYGYVCEMHMHKDPLEVKKALRLLFKLQPYLRGYYCFEKEELLETETEELFESCFEIFNINCSESNTKVVLEEKIDQISQLIHHTSAPLIRVIFSRNQMTNKVFLILVASHIVVDGFSIKLFFDQMDLLLKDSEFHYPRLKGLIENEVTLVQERFNTKTDASEILNFFLSDNDKSLPLFEETEEFIWKYHVESNAFNSLREITTKEKISFEVIIIDLVVQALNKVYEKTSLIEIIHSGRRSLSKTDSLRAIIGWFDLTWPINLNLIQEKKPLERLKELNNLMRSTEKLAWTYSCAYWDKKNTTAPLISPFQPRVEFSYKPLIEIISEHGIFTSASYFKNDYFHGNTFSKKLRRYRDLFVRPIMHPDSFEIVFYGRKNMFNIELCIERLDFEMKNYLNQEVS